MQDFMLWAFQQQNYVPPIYLVHRVVIPVTFYSHEPVSRHEAFLKEAARYPVISEQPHQPAVPGHHNKHVSPLRFPAQLVADNGQHPGVLATHVRKVPDVVEPVKSGDAQHSTSSFSTNSFSPV